MSIDDYFSDTYDQAREKFFAAAKAADAKIVSYTLPELKGPAGEDLITDVARLGPHDAKSLLMIISGVHGIEGFAGSGCQVGYLRNKLYEQLGQGVGAVLIHALNPYGFAYFRRVNEKNVDVNRNFQDFSKPLPSSEAYDDLHDLLLPKDWVGPSRGEADAKLSDFLKVHGLGALQAAVSSGQYSHCDGLFYGGDEESWSNKIVQKVMKEVVAWGVKHVAVLDLHSGLGKPGFGEPIFIGSEDDYQRALQLYGPEIKDMNRGESVSAKITGSIADGLSRMKGQTQITYVAIEYGTIPMLDVLTALRADHWLNAYSQKRTADLENEVRTQMRNAFYTDTSEWKAAVYERFADFAVRASRRLSGV